MITGSAVLPLPSFLPFYFRVRTHPTFSEPGTGWWSCWFWKRQSRCEFSSKTFISEHLKMFLDIFQNLNATLRDILQDLYIPLPIARSCFVFRSTVHSEWPALSSLVVTSRPVTRGVHGVRSHPPHRPQRSAFWYSISKLRSAVG